MRRFSGRLKGWGRGGSPGLKAWRVSLSNQDKYLVQDLLQNLVNSVRLVQNLVQERRFEFLSQHKNKIKAGTNDLRYCFFRNGNFKCHDC